MFLVKKLPFYYCRLVEDSAEKFTVISFPCNCVILLVPSPQPEVKSELINGEEMETFSCEWWTLGWGIFEIREDQFVGTRYQYSVQNFVVQYNTVNPIVK